MNRRQSGTCTFFFWFFLCLLLLTASCSKNGSEASTESVFKEVKRQSDPVAELTAEIAVATPSPQGSLVDTVTTEIQTKHGPKVEELKGSLCKTLQGASKKDPDELRATAEQAVRDSFVFKLIQRSAAAPQERQIAIVQSLAIKSSRADGSPLDGAESLKDASLTDGAGTLRIPDPGTTEYTKYTDWLSKNDALLGFTDTVTKDYTEAIRDCSLK